MGLEYYPPNQMCEDMLYSDIEPYIDEVLANYN